uniref:sacsin N-terminal ATP-binding-like domain-containing protein n=1 Tax=uncultured Dysgonomonas sp. TaxID=206096 RepID=UPI0025885F94|nr:hypothetical protein [uncultured Dysgonomonas sp.]
MVIQSIEDGRKEDGNRSIADKIIKRLHDLEKTVENNKGRWAWELLQNAKDSIADYEDRTVAIQIELDDDKVEFRHNGEHFTEKDIRGLINQISSKEVEEEEVANKTGKFGTGFLTTHLLSRVIYIKGIVETQKHDFYQFEFPLDRDGKTTGQLVPKIEKAWEEFHSSAEKIISKYDKAAFNTSFCYLLETEEQKDIAQIGIEEFTKLIPYVLTFITSIESVEIINNLDLSTVKFTNNQELIDDLIVPITRKEGRKESKIYILYTTSDKVAIAIEVEKIDDYFYIKSIENIPKLFCDFPLMGTENFHFPVVVNSFFFNPQTERDGIWLKGDTDKEVLENKSLLIESVELYKKMIEAISKKNYHNFYNTAITKHPSTDEKYFDEKWYKEKIQTPLRNFIVKAKIVELEDNEEQKSIEELWFPLKSYSDEVQEQIWKYTFDLYSESVCKKSHLNDWCKVSWGDWNKQTYEQLILDIAGLKDIKTLHTSLGGTKKETFDWLNSLYEFILKDDSNLSYIRKNAIFPNKNEVFKLKSQLYIDNIQDNDLLSILSLLGEDWKDILLHDNIYMEDHQDKDKEDIASRITDRQKKIQTRDKDDDYITAISLLSEWFENHKEEAKELFSELHRKRAELFMDTINDKDSLYKIMRSNTELSQLSKVAQALDSNPQLMDNLKKANDLTELLSEFGANDIYELRQLIIQSQNNEAEHKIAITQEVLTSLGVKSAEELEEVLKDKDNASRFAHTSTPNVEMFLFAETLINRAKQRVIDHIQTLEEYDCDEMDEVSTTVIRGIKKEGVELSIVVRPSDYGKVIIYHGAEKDILDYEYAELWIDNGSDTPRHLTLGRILKNTGINKIPV